MKTQSSNLDLDFGFVKNIVYKSFIISLTGGASFAKKTVMKRADNKARKNFLVPSLIEVEFLSKTEVEFLLTSEVEFLSIQGRYRRAVALKHTYT